jgi:hypothetical protein
MVARSSTAEEVIEAAGVGVSLSVGLPTHMDHATFACLEPLGARPRWGPRSDEHQGFETSWRGSGIGRKEQLAHPCLELP